MGNQQGISEKEAKALTDKTHCTLPLRQRACACEHARSLPRPFMVLVFFAAGPLRRCLVQVCTAGWLCVCTCVTTCMERALFRALACVSKSVFKICSCLWLRPAGGWSETAAS